MQPQTARAQLGGGGWHGGGGGNAGVSWNVGGSWNGGGGNVGGGNAGGSGVGGARNGGGSGGGAWNGAGDGNAGSSWNTGGGGNGGGWHAGGAWYAVACTKGGTRYGWWWVAPRFGWFAYDTPVYPYPDPDVCTQAMSPIPYWYYCQNPAGYCSYVTQCSGPWQPVPAQPAPASFLAGPGYSPQPSYAPHAGGPGNSTASDLNQQEPNRLGAAPVNPLYNDDSTG